MAEMNIEKMTQNVAKKAIQELRDNGVIVSRWIPVSERLPDKTGLYLISTGDLVSTYPFDGHNFRLRDNTCIIYVDAWMELPKPYNGSEE